MNTPSTDEGIIAALMERFEKQRLPRVLSMRDAVDRGETLSNFDLELLEEIFADANKVRPLLDRHPEYQDMAARMTHLYREITQKALENEQSAD